MSLEDLPKVSIRVEESHLKKVEFANTMPDPRFDNWKKWIKVRENVQNVLGKNLQRRPEELLMNACEDERVVKEEKMVLDYTKIPEPDSQRGCPGFWKLPNALNEPCDDSKYFAVPLKEDTCSIPEIEYVRVPDFIKAEKATVSTRDIHLGWKNLSYKQEVSNKLRHKILRVQPYKPDLDNLMILGKILENLEETVTEEKAETIIENIDTNQHFDVSKSLVRPILVINGFNIYSEDTGTKEIKLTFDYDFSNKSISTNFLNIKNEGKIAIRVYWKRCQKFNLFSDIIKPKYEETKFVFNKNQIVILPGKSVKLPVWFKMNKTGRYYEEWEFMSSPSLNSKVNIIIQLTGISFISDLTEKCKKIDEKLERSLRETIITNALNNALEQTFMYKRPIIYMYNKAKLFEAINSNFDPVQTTSQYIYDEGVVSELNNFYEKVKLPHHLNIWNYNIEYLKFVTEEKEIYEKSKLIKNYIYTVDSREEKGRIDDNKDVDIPTTCDEKHKELEASGKKKGKKDKEKKEKGKKDKSKSEGKKDKKSKASTENKMEKVVQITKDESMEEMPSYTNKFKGELDQILKRLTTSVNFRNEEQQKYAYAHSIFIAWCNKLCNYVEELQDSCNVHPPSNYPEIKTSHIVENSSRLTFQYIDEVLPPKKVFLISANLRHRPPPEILNGIPIEDCENRYKAYFNITETTNKAASSKKDKKGKNKEKSKKENKKNDKKEKISKDEKKKKKTDKKEVENIKKEDAIDLDFDLYKIIELPNDIDFETFPIEIINTDAQQIDNSTRISVNYRYNLYVLFYTILENIIMDILEIFDDSTCKILPPPSIKQIENSYTFIENYNQASNIKFVNLDLITKYLCDNEEISDIKEQFVSTLRENLKKEVSIEKPELNPYINKRASLTSLWKCLETYEKPPQGISDRKTFRTMRKIVDPENKHDVYTHTSESEEEPPYKDMNIQTECQKLTFVGEFHNNKTIDVIAEDKITKEIKSLQKSNLENYFLKCTPSTCSQQSIDNKLKTAAAMESNQFESIQPVMRIETAAKIISEMSSDKICSKMELIEKALRSVENKLLQKSEMSQQSSESIRSQTVIEVCKIFEQKGLLRSTTNESLDHMEQEFYYDTDDF